MQSSSGGGVTLQKIAWLQNYIRRVWFSAFFRNSVIQSNINVESESIVFCSCILFCVDVYNLSANSILWHRQPLKGINFSVLFVFLVAEEIKKRLMKEEATKKVTLLHWIAEE